ESHHATPPLLLREVGDGVVGPAELEGPGALEVLAFEPRPRARELVEAAGRDDGRAVRDAREADRRRLDVAERRFRAHFRRRTGRRPGTRSARSTSRRSVTGSCPPR